MLFDKRLISIPIIGFAIFLLAFLFYSFNKPQPELKPIPNTPETNEEISDQPTYWFVQFSVKNQKSTAYTEETYAPLAASGKSYKMGTVAVHPNYPLYNGGNALKPVIPFGTTIYLDNPIKIHDKTYNSLIINDTGDVNYRLWRNYPYWIDIYMGNNTSFNRKAADIYGIKSVNYHWYEPWPEN